jgi:hypothetical protein
MSKEYTVQHYKTQGATKESRKTFRIISNVFCIIGGILLAFSGFFEIQLNEEKEYYSEFKENAVAVVGTVIDTETSPYMSNTINGKTTDYYYAEVEYIAQGKQYTCKDVSVKGKYDIGDNIDLYYNENSPKDAISDLTSPNELLMSICTYVLGGLGIFFFIVDFVIWIVSKKTFKSKVDDFPKYNPTQDDMPWEK